VVDADERREELGSVRITTKIKVLLFVILFVAEPTPSRWRDGKQSLFTNKKLVFVSSSG